MVHWLRSCWLVSLVGLLSVVPARACGPFLYENSELDRFSFLEPSILTTKEWTPFLAFASPPLGQPASVEGERIVQSVIRPHRTGDLVGASVSNLLFDAETGDDSPLLAANQAWWADYFLTEHKKALTAEELKSAIEGPLRPAWLSRAEKIYFSLLDGAPDDMNRYDQALAQARNPQNPVGLRHRFAFWVVRSLAVNGDPTAPQLFREFCPGAASDLPLARAQSWAARVVAEDDPVKARDLWVDLFVRFPALRVTVFASLGTLPAQAWTGPLSAGALVARSFLDGRDFSPETLAALSRAEKAAGGNGSWTESVFYSMAEQIEGEAGVFALFGLVDPNERPPTGLFTALLNQAEALVDQGIQKPTRTWWIVASYLSLFDGDPGRAQRLLARIPGLGTPTEPQKHQTDWIATLVRMNTEKDRDWSDDTQKQVLSALAWGRSLNAADHNRGLYHSVAVLAAQKYLARGHLPQAVLAFGLLDSPDSRHLYSVRSDDDFWAYGWNPNNPVHLVMDALFTDDDIELWKGLLARPGTEPLTSDLAGRSVLSLRDLTWWQAHRALRRGDGRRALALLEKLTPAAENAVFPDRRLSYSLDLDPLNPREGRGMRTVSAATLAAVMIRVEDEARLHPSSTALLEQGVFWFSLQISGLPLLFAQPPPVISFVNGNWEYYGYDGRDVGRSTAVVGTYPLGRPSQTDSWAARLNSFYQKDFSTIDRTRRAFEAVVARHDNPEAEFRALLFLQALDGQRMRALADPRFDRVELAQTFRNTCGLFWDLGI